MENIRPVTVTDILCARDQRAARQKAFLSRHAVPLISFTMNIAGGIKCDPLIERAFREGQARVLRELDRMGAKVLEEEESISFTGCEHLWAVDFDAQALKRRMCLIEESDALGRLFDLDVISRDGSHLSRGSERDCLICGAPVRACARSRAHSAQELYEKAHEIIRTHFREQFIRRTGEMAQRALLLEAVTTPKPGLVDCRNTGAHRDMDLFSFMQSASALRPYFEECVRLGLDGADEIHLQYQGMLAEDQMLSAAHANTHKGAIFSLGILCRACGCCGEDAPMEAILQKAAETGAVYLRELEIKKATSTGGEAQYQQYGLTGARGEAASGFESAVSIGLPALRQALADGRSLEEAGVSALMHLISQVHDSNIIRRAGMEGQKWAMQQAREAIDHGLADLEDMDDRFIERNISPGGSADLLAVTYFLHFLENS
ncbi:MAG: citrate lyase holo-[acyl-carrier protein] synthase [Clostridia bacterium]|nr:citrate lyase holo-[acyl-carrier protein] synthase [Clostridia bacterium]